MKNEKEIGKIVRSLRGNMSLRDFGSKCGISHTTIDNIEKGVDVRTGKPTQVKMITLEKIALACGVQMSIFLDETQAQIENPDSNFAQMTVEEKKMYELFQLVPKDKQEEVVKMIEAALKMSGMKKEE